MYLETCCIFTNLCQIASEFLGPAVPVIGREISIYVNILIGRAAANEIGCKIRFMAKYIIFLQKYFNYLNLKGRRRLILAAKFRFTWKCILFLQIWFEYPSEFVIGVWSRKWCDIFTNYEFTSNIRISKAGCGGYRPRNFDLSRKIVFF